MRFKAKAESEAEQLRAEQLPGGKVLFSGTKSGKNRSVPLAGDLYRVLRHRFASHFMMNGGNILVLQRVLGHSDIKMTMGYAHLAPDHLEEVLRLNPISMWEQCGTIR